MAPGEGRRKSLTAQGPIVPEPLQGPDYSNRVPKSIKQKGMRADQEEERDKLKAL